MHPVKNGGVAVEPDGRAGQSQPRSQQLGLCCNRGRRPRTTLYRRHDDRLVCEIHASGSDCLSGAGSVEPAARRLNVCHGVILPDSCRSAYGLGTEASLKLFTFGNDICAGKIGNCVRGVMGRGAGARHWVGLAARRLASGAGQRREHSPRNSIAPTLVGSHRTALVEQGDLVSGDQNGRMTVFAPFRGA